MTTFTAIPSLNEDGSYTVRAYADGQEIYAWGVGNNNKLVQRLCRCVEAGKAFKLSDGRWTTTFLARIMNAELRRLGF